MHPPARGRPDAPDAEASVVSDCAEREAVTECKAVPERKAVVPIAERESIAIPIAERKAIASITEREAIIAVAERAVDVPSRASHIAFEGAHGERRPPTTRSGNDCHRELQMSHI